MRALSSAISSGLRWLGKRGTILMALSLLVGLLLPDVGPALAPFREASVAGFTFAAFLRCDWGVILAELRRPLPYLLLTVVSMIAVPWALATGGAWFGYGDSPVLHAVALSLMAPTAGSSAAFAMLLGLNVPVAVTATMVGTLLMPLIMPLVAATVMHVHLAASPVSMAVNLGVLIAVSSLGAALCRVVFRPSRETIDITSLAISVVSLATFALGATSGLQAAVLATPLLVATLIGVAFVVTVGLQAFGALLLSVTGDMRTSLTGGLCSGYRSYGLVWASLGAASTGLFDLYMVCVLVPCYVLPMVSKRPYEALIARRDARRLAAALRVCATPAAAGAATAGALITVGEAEPLGECVN